MSDEYKKINIDIVVQGNAEEKYKAITRQLRALNLERDRLIQSRDKGDIFAVKYEERVVALKQQEITLQKQLSELEALSARNRNKALQEESGERQAIAKAELKAIQERNEALAKEKTRQKTGDPAIERRQLANAERIRQAQGQSYYNEIFGQRQSPQMLSYVSAGIGLFESFNTVTKGLTTAQTALNAVTTATPWGAIAKLIAAGAASLATYAFYAGEAANAQAKTAQKQADLITAKQSEIEVSKQQIDFMETLGNTYVQLQADLKAVQGNEEKTATVQKTMATVTKELTAVVGEEAAKRILDSKDIQEAITQEQKVHAEKVSQMEVALGELRAEQIKLMKDAVDASNDRIGAINNEAIAFDKAADAIGKALGTIDEIWFRYYRGKAKYLRDQSAFISQQNEGLQGTTLGEDIGLGLVNAEMSSIGIFPGSGAILQEQAATADAMAEEIKNNANAKEREIQRKATSELSGLYAPKGYYEQKTGPSGPNAPDNEEQRKRIEIQAEYKRIMADMSVSTNKYSEALDDLNTKEALYGQTVESTNERYDLMAKRIQQLTSEQSKLTTERNKYQSQLDKYLAEDQEFEATAASTIAGWSGMSKGERKDYLVRNREDFQQFKTLKSLLDILSELDVKILETSKNTSKLENQWDKELLGDTLNPDKQRERNLRNIGLAESTALAQVNKRNPLYQWDENAISLAAERQRYQQYANYGQQLEDERKKLIASLPEQMKDIQTKIDQENLLADSVEKTEKLKILTDALAAAQNENTAALQNNTDKQNENNSAKAKSEEKQKELAKQASQNIRKLWADSFIDMAQNGSSFKDVMKKIWNDIQKDAIYALFKVKHEASTASQMFGKGKSGGTSSGSTLPPVPPKSGKSGIGKAANGGVLTTPTIAGEAGEEVAIPVENNTQNSKKLLDYASNKLGYYPGRNTYVPYFKDSSLATQPVVNVQMQQQQNHIDELQRQTQVLTAMLNHLMNNPGVNTTVLPVVTQVSSEQVLEVLAKNPSALSNILGRHRNSGFSR
ncbi:hypothetical protein [Sporomusa aerivorans]|uniref:hypothetical protein n=1 Tax=Sporomusa aerivorans TaxID=204936 RepID=UPI00352B4A4C